MYTSTIYFAYKVKIMKVWQLGRQDLSPRPLAMTLSTILGPCSLKRERGKGETGDLQSILKVQCIHTKIIHT